MPSTSLSLCWGSMENIALDEHIRCAAAAGFDAVTVSPGSYTEAIQQGYTDTSIKALLSDNDIRISGFDPVLSWVDGAPELDGDEHFAIATRTDISECVRIATALDCPLLNLPQGLAEADFDILVKSFANACDIAAEQNRLVTVEFLPFSKTNNLATAWQIVEQANRDNGGLMIDLWHFYQSGGQLADLNTVPMDKIFGIQLNGATQCEPKDWIDQTMNARLQADQGDYDVATIVQQLTNNGLDIILDVEVFSATLRALPAEQRAQQCYQATQNMLNTLG